MDYVTLIRALSSNRYNRGKGAERDHKKETEKGKGMMGGVDKMLSDLRLAGIPLDPVQVRSGASRLALLILALGLLTSVLLMFSPVGQDLDGDGINDIYQDIHEQKTVVVEEGDYRTEVVGHYGEISPLRLMFIGIIPPLAAAAFTAIYATSYPASKARRSKNRMIGAVPEAISYLSMSMYISRNLDRAVKFASENTSGLMAKELKGIIWGLYSRSYNRVEEGLMRFATRWGEEISELKQALYSIKTASLKGADTGLQDALRNANDIAVKGAKGRVMHYASKLSAPTMLLFSMGVVLPLVISAMIPLADLGGNSLLTMIVLLNLVFPLSTGAYAFHTLSKRPAMSGDYGESGEQAASDVSPFLLFAMVFLAAWALFGLMGIAPRVLFPVSLLTASVPLSAFLLFKWSQRAARARSVRRMESEFPDVLFNLGSRLMDGMSPERALKVTAEDLGESGLAKLLRGIHYNLQVMRIGASNVEKLPSFKKIDSPMIKASLATVMSSADKHPVKGGEIAMNIASYLKEIKSIEDEAKAKLAPTVSMMMATVLIFAPIVLGISVGLFGMLNQQFGALGPAVSGQELLPISMTESGMSTMEFGAVMSVYLVEMLVIITFFATGLQFGDRAKAEARVTMAKALPLTLAIYLAVFWLSGLFFAW